MTQLAGTTASLGPYTWSDFIALDEDDPRELLDGHLVVFEVPTKTHGQIVALLIFFLTGWAREHDAGRVLASGYKIRFNDQRGYMPDLQFFRSDNLPADDQEHGLERGRPDLVVEVISPSSRSKDRVRKLQDYAALGIPEYWLIDPEARMVVRLVLRDGRYSIVDVVDDEGVFQPESFAGLVIALKELW